LGLCARNCLALLELLTNGFSLAQMFRRLKRPESLETTRRVHGYSGRAYKDLASLGFQCAAGQHMESFVACPYSSGLYS